MSFIRFKQYPTQNSRNFNNQFFNRDISQFVGRENFQTTPKVNIVETEDNFGIEVAAPGLSKEDFNIKLNEDVLTISVKKEAKNEEIKARYTRREFGFTSFERSFTLPETVDQGNILAKYENGILNLTLPKLEETLKPNMEIEVS